MFFNHSWRNSRRPLKRKNATGINGSTLTWFYISQYGLVSKQSINYCLNCSEINFYSVLTVAGKIFNSMCRLSTFKMLLQRWCHIPGAGFRLMSSNAAIKTIAGTFNVFRILLIFDLKPGTFARTFKEDWLEKRTSTNPSLWSCSNDGLTVGCHNCQSLGSVGKTWPLLVLISVPSRSKLAILKL